MKKTLRPIYEEYKQLGIDQQIDYAKFYLYSIITHSTAIEGSTMTEEENRLLFDEGIGAQKPLIEQIAEYRKSTEEVEPTPSSQKNSQKSSQKIIELIKENAGITTQAMADNLGISRRAVAKAIAKLQAEKIIRRVGPDKGGHWEIIKNGQNPL